MFKADTFPTTTGTITNRSTYVIIDIQSIYIMYRESFDSALSRITDDCDAIYIATCP